MKSVLITGSNGFIGKNLIKRLKQDKVEVIEFSHQTGKDITSTDDFQDLPKADVVFHLAAVSGYRSCNENTALAYRVNVGGTINVLEYCRRVKAKLVFPSTYVYDAPYNVYKKESGQAKPMTHYSMTKWLGEELCRFYSRVFNVNTLILRTANVYGPGQSDIYLIPILVNHLKTGKPLELPGQNIERSFIYVDDLVTAYAKLAQISTKPGEVFNVSFCRATTIANLVNTVEKTFGKKVNVAYSGHGRPHEINLNRMNIAKIKSFINWEPRITLAEGLKKLQRSQNL